MCRYRTIPLVPRRRGQPAARWYFSVTYIDSERPTTTHNRNCASVGRLESRWDDRLMTMARKVANDATGMNDRRQRNPAADRRLWNERPGRGRTLVWWIGMPLVVGMIAFAGVAASRP